MIEAIRSLCHLQGCRRPSSRSLEEQTRQWKSLLAVKNELRQHEEMLATALLPFDDVGVDDSSDHHHVHIPYVPWVRIFSREKAPKPTYGYFVDLLFSWDRKLYVAILPGVYGLEYEDIDCWRDSARDALRQMRPQISDSFLSEIDLHAPAACSYAHRYQHGVILAEKIDLPHLTQEKLLGRICIQLELLAIIYGN